MGVWAGICVCGLGLWAGFLNKRGGVDFVETRLKYGCVCWNMLVWAGCVGWVSEYKRRS